MDVLDCGQAEDVVDLGGNGSNLSYQVYCRWPL